MARLTAAAGSSSCWRASTELLSSSNRAPDIGRPRPLSAWAYERRLIQGRVLEAATAREGADEAKPDRVSMARIRREAQGKFSRVIALPRAWHERGDGTEKSPHIGRAKLTPSGVHLKFLSRAGGRYVTDVTVPPQMCHLCGAPGGSLCTLHSTICSGQNAFEAARPLTVICSSLGADY